MHGSPLMDNTSTLLCSHDVCITRLATLQEAGLEREKEAASALLLKAKAAEATLKEGERKAEASRLVLVLCCVVLHCIGVVLCRVRVLWLAGWLSSIKLCKLRWRHVWYLSFRSKQ